MFFSGSKIVIDHKLLHTVEVTCVTKCLICLPSTLCICHVLALCRPHRPPQPRRRHNGSALLLWQRANNPKKSPLSPRPHPLPGTHQKTLSKHSSPSRRGPRAPPSPCRPSQLTPSRARPPPALQRASTPSPPCPGPRASGSPSVIISLQPLAVRARGRV